MTQTIENHERLWSVTEAAWAIGMSRYGVQKAIDRAHLSPAEFGTTRNGGYRYRESDIKRLFGDRFVKSRVPRSGGQDSCLLCGRESRFENYDATHGLCLDCWCRELNVFLIGRRMKCGDAIKAMIESLKERGIIQ